MHCVRTSIFSLLALAVAAVAVPSTATPRAVGSGWAIAADDWPDWMRLFTVKALGVGIVDIDTEEGDLLANLNLGSTVTLR